MARALLSVLMAAALCAPSVQSAEQPKPKKVESWKADVAITINIGEQEVTATGAVRAKRPAKVRMELATSAMPGVKQHIYSDGEVVCVYLPQLKVATKVNAAQARQKLGVTGQVPDAADPLAGTADGSAKELPDETIDGEACRVVEAKPAAVPEVPLPFKPATVKLWISKKSGMLVRQDLLASDGAAMVTQRFSNIETGLDIPDSEFAFKPPKGVTVMDLTDGAVSALKQLK